MTTNTVLECRNISKFFGDVRALDNVDLQLERGEFLCLLGPSGCGKTTTLRVIAGLEQPDEGNVKLAARTVNSVGTFVPPEGRNVGVVFQDFALFPHMNVQENVLYGLHNLEDPLSRASEVLDLVGLDGHHARMPHELSGGQQQRVALARALGPNPEVVLFDEPFSNLDARLRERLRGDVHRIMRKTETSAILVTHDQQEALSFGDRVVVMYNGRVLQDASPTEIYREPATPTVASLVGRANFLPAVASGHTVRSELGIHRLKGHYEDEVLIMYRPEDLAVCPDGQGNGRVLWRQYYGDSQTIRVALDSDTHLDIRQDPEAFIENGARVRVIPRSDPVVYSDEECIRAGAPSEQEKAS